MFVWSRVALTMVPNWFKLTQNHDNFFEPLRDLWSLHFCIHSKMPCVVSVVAHDSASKECRRKMGAAYALNRTMDGSVGEEDLRSLRRKLEEDATHDLKSRSQKQKLIH